MPPTAIAVWLTVIGADELRQRALSLPVKTHLEGSAQVWARHLETDTGKLGNFQPKRTRMKTAQKDITEVTAEGQEIPFKKREEFRGER